MLCLLDVFRRLARRPRNRICAAGEAIGLNGATFDQCLDSGKWAAAVSSGTALGEKMGVNSTPTLYINGRAVIGAMPFENFKAIIDEELARR